MAKSTSKNSAGKQHAQGKAAARAANAGTHSPRDWRAATLDEARRLILAVSPEIVEERKWKKPTNPAGVPVWSLGGIICTGETYKEVVKLTFAKGASLPDPKQLFNSSLEGHARRAIDIREGEKINARALQTLVRAAIDANLSAKGATPRKAKPASTPGTVPTRAARNKPATAASAPAKPAKPAKKSGDRRQIGVSRTGEKVVLLSGGNPQIAKADGDAPVQAYIAAMPGWKSDLGQRLDELITRAVPTVQKAVKWNSPFFGVAGQGWFLSFHVLTKYVKVTFFNGKSLRPLPPGATERSGDARWIDIYEDDALDEKQLTDWIKQSAKLPGWLA